MVVSSVVTLALHRILNSCELSEPVVKQIQVVNLVGPDRTTVLPGILVACSYETSLLLPEHCCPFDTLVGIYNPYSICL